MFFYCLPLVSVMQISVPLGETVSPLTDSAAVMSKLKHCSVSVMLSLLMGMETHWIRASSDIVTSPLLLE